MPSYFYFFFLGRVHFVDWWLGCMQTGKAKQLWSANTEAMALCYRSSNAKGDRQWWHRHKRYQKGCCCNGKINTFGFFMWYLNAASQSKILHTLPSGE